jgi:hypothetical protein
MAPAPPAASAVTGTVDQAAASGTRVPAAEPPGHRPAKARLLLPRRAAPRAPTALPAACSDGTVSAWTETVGRPRRLARLRRRAPRTGVSYYDPRFERPDLVEDDYYRLRTQPRGW